jgi:curved DNA-binding protein CbpA
MNAGAQLERDEVLRRFRRLIRLAHPDHGGASDAAAERIAELTEARELLLAEVPTRAASGADR